MPYLHTYGFILLIYTWEIMIIYNGEIHEKKKWDTVQLQFCKKWVNLI